jgi:putative ATPase
MQQLDYGKGYRYAHDEADGFAAGENYFPEGLQPPPLYEPVARGLEIKIGEKLHTLRQRNAQAQAQAAQPPSPPLAKEAK